MEALIALVIAAAISWLWCRWLPSIGSRLGYVDLPDDDGLKVHRHPAVPLAAPGLLAGSIVGFAVIGGFDPWLVGGLVLIASVGVLDDRFDLLPVVRLGTELVAAAVISVRWLEVGPGIAVFGLVLIVVTVNAVNLYDGIDLLAGSTGLVTLLAIGTLSVAIGPTLWLPFVFAAALAGFLPHNVPPARVFLGDGGAYLLGSVLAVSIVDLGAGGSWIRLIAGLGFLGLFAVDLVVTVLRRLHQNAALFRGDRNHIYDRLFVRVGDTNWVVRRLVTLHMTVVVAVGVCVWLLPPGAGLAAVGVIGLTATYAGWRWAAGPAVGPA